MLRIKKEGIFMRKTCKFIGGFLLSLSALIIVVGPASMGGVAVEEMPESIKNKR